MWVMTTDGFYSAVQHRTSPGWLIVRSRTEGDITRLAHWLDEITDRWVEIVHTPDADYAWRVTVRKADFAQYLVASAEAIDYPNFKDAIYDRQGRDRARVYGEVWGTLLDLQKDFSASKERNA